jgi:molybdopterin-guanine dinucleotide biosynthesis protein A
LNAITSMNAYILGGGRSSRMSRDKAFLEYGGKHLIDITIECIAAIFGSVYLVGRSYSSPLLTGCIEDEISDIGPLGGIHTALKSTDKLYNFFVGIDYPNIDRTLVLALFSLFKSRTPQYEGLIPIAPDGPHPLFAFYSKSCLPSVERCIGKKDYRIRCIARYSNIYFSPLLQDLSEANLEEVDPDEDKKKMIERSLININSYDDYILSKKTKRKKIKNNKKYKGLLPYVDT